MTSDQATSALSRPKRCSQAARSKWMETLGGVILLGSIVYLHAQFQRPSDQATLGLVRPKRSSQAVRSKWVETLGEVILLGQSCTCMRSFSDPVTSLVTPKLGSSAQLCEPVTGSAECRDCGVSVRVLCFFMFRPMLRFGEYRLYHPIALS